MATEQDRTTKDDEPVAIVTGGASGMGLATARLLGADHRVVIADLGADRLEAAVDELSADGVSVIARECDVTSRVAVDELFATAVDAGRPRCVVHAAGISPQMAAAEPIIRVNALGTVHIGNASLAVASDGFALVNVASFAAHTSPGFLQPRRTFGRWSTDPEGMVAKLTRLATRLPATAQSGLAYSLSKAFVVWYCRDVVSAFGAKGARVLSVSPGSIDTPMGRIEERSGAGKLAELSALGRFGRTDEVAELLAFCASEKPGYLTGVDILCDGGSKAAMGVKGMVDMMRG